MSNRPTTDSDASAVPRGEIEEITDRIDLLELPPPKEISGEELNVVMASFEEQLLELNQTLRGATGGRITSLRTECKKTEEVVEGLNSAIDGRLKGHG